MTYVAGGESDVGVPRAPNDIIRSYTCALTFTSDV